MTACNRPDRLEPSAEGGTPLESLRLSAAATETSDEQGGSWLQSSGSERQSSARSEPSGPSHPDAHAHALGYGSSTEETNNEVEPKLAQRKRPEAAPHPPLPPPAYSAGYPAPVAPPQPVTVPPSRETLRAQNNMMHVHTNVLARPRAPSVAST